MDVKKFEDIYAQKLKRFFKTNSNRKVYASDNMMYLINRIIGENKNLFKLLEQCSPGKVDINFRFPSEDCTILSFSDIDFIQNLLANYKIGQYKPNVKLVLIPRLTDALAAYLLDDDFYFEEAEICLFGQVITDVDQRKGKQTITIESLDIDFLPLDTDLVTMFSNNFIPRLWAFNELTVISEINSALESIKSNCSGFASVTSFGQKSEIIANNFHDIDPENSTTHLVLLDRSLDLVTPLISQSGYEGLVAELHGIQYGIIKYSDSQQNSAFYFLSSENDRIISKIRQFNFSEEENYLKEELVKLQEHYKKKEKPNTSNFDCQKQIENFQQESQFAVDHKSIKVYFDINQNVSNALSNNRWYIPAREQEISLIKSGKVTKQIIEKMIFYGADFRQVIRLICLDYAVNGRIDGYENIVAQLYANYGLQQIPLLMRLKQMELLSPEPNPSNKFRQMCKELNLIAKSEDDDAAKHYLGYVPLFVRIVEKLFKGSSAYSELCTALSKQGIQTKQYGNLMVTPDSNIMVCFIGGCTHSEINLMRRISTRDHISVNFFTTRIFTPNEFISDIAYGIPGWDRVIVP